MHYSWKLPAYNEAFLLVLAFLLTIGAFLLTIFWFLLTVGAFLFTFFLTVGVFLCLLWESVSNKGLKGL